MLDRVSAETYRSDNAEKGQQAEKKNEGAGELPYPFFSGDIGERVS